MPRRGRIAVVVGIAVAVATAVGVIAGARRAGPPAPTRVVAVAEAAAPVTVGAGEGSAAERNTTRDDYIGPDACGECHPENHARWKQSLHAAMNGIADAVTPSGAPAVKGDFHVATVSYAGGTARFERDGGVLVMRFDVPGRVQRRYQVTRTIGSHALQEYVGVQIVGPEPAGDPAYSTEIRLPFGYWLARPGWYPQPYYDEWFPAEYAADGTPEWDAYFPEPTPWATRCAWCHNTYAFERRLARSDERGLGRGLEQFYRRVSGGVQDVEALPVDELVTVGISCESCHLGGRAHADGAPISFTPRGPELARRELERSLGGREDPVVVNAICAQCHSTPAPRFPDGASARNSTEALDLAAGACDGIRCTDCHDPHAGGETPAATGAACARCHAMTPDHGGHTSTTCIDCHMPRIVQGIASMVRSHRISSPANPAMLGADGVNACNLCHLDRSVAWTAAQLGVAGTDDRPAADAWLASDKSAVRIAAAHALAAKDGRAAAPRLTAILDSPIAYDRMWFLFALESALGRRLSRHDYDPLAPPSHRADQAAALAR
jgi:hypothetical protein